VSRYCRGVTSPAPEWTYVLSALMFVVLLVLVGFAIGWWVAGVIFVPSLALATFGFVRRARIRRHKTYVSSH
jgi:NhaP-type Na+/H+ and K+/H+ antiporter